MGTNNGKGLDRQCSYSELSHSDSMRNGEMFSHFPLSLMEE